MANHNRGYYRRVRKQHINRKKRIIHKLGDYWSYKFDGMLSKGKIHCSCPMCRGKDFRNRHIKTLQELESELYLKEYLKNN